MLSVNSVAALVVLRGWKNVPVSQDLTARLRSVDTLKTV